MVTLRSRNITAVEVSFRRSRVIVVPIPWATAAKALGAAGSKAGKALGPVGAVVGVVGTATSVAGHAGKMNESRKIRKNLCELFREHFLTQDGLLREGVVEVECAGLTFTREAELRKDWSGSEYYAVRVVNNSKTGDHPERVRRFGYFPNSKKVGWPPTYMEWY